jgi:N-acetyl-gamma-glutamyl-phosphate reductase/acetylglutamate kinase
MNGRVVVLRSAALRLDPELHFCDLQPEEIATAAVPGVADVDAWVLALPNGLCDRYAAAIAELTALRRGPHGAPAPLVIDLSADQRFDESGTWVYGCVCSLRFEARAWGALGAAN